MINELKAYKDTVDYITEKGNYNIMEVCGTHTEAVNKFGIREALNNINLISGPGCPICVTPSSYIDYIYKLSFKKDFVVSVFGDLLKVIGTRDEITLLNAKAKGGKILTAFSSVEAVNYAIKNQDKKVVFVGIGFETTIPSTAIAINEAIKNKLNNFYVLSLHKKIRPVMEELMKDEKTKIDGFICPGHVAMVTGAEQFNFLNDYNVPGVIAGFQAMDILNAIKKIVDMLEKKEICVVNNYASVVRKNGNKVALELIEKIFCTRNDIWRGIGMVSESGYKIKNEYENFDIEKLIPIKIEIEREKECYCKDVIKGIIKPFECKSFGRECNPNNPKGPCMISKEGSCSAFYRNRGV